MVVLGSGGHTGEIMPIIAQISKDKRFTGSHYTFICADTDSLSFKNPQIPAGSSFIKIPRARKVGQSFVTSIFTTLKSILAALKLMFQKKMIELTLYN